MKLDLGKILKSINKGERPSSDTLYVSSKNDPRLKAYQDSLNLYKGSSTEKDIKDLTKYGQYKKVKPYMKGQKIQPTEMYLPNLEVIQDLERKGIKYSVNQPIIEKGDKSPYYKNKDGSVIDKRDGTIVLSQADIYKKPERPVAYRKPTVDTIYVDNPNNQRLRAYQDSLKLHNLSLKIANRPNGDISYGRKPEGEFHKNFTAKDAMHYIYSVTPDETTMKKLSRKSKILPTRYYPGEGGGVYFKKPTKPVSYKKPEPKKQNIEQVKQEVLQAIQNKYEGSPVYSSTSGSGGPSALVGFENKGDTTFIKPEDFDRFAVPKYARQFIQNKSKKK
jgi:hypothetical protein